MATPSIRYDVRINASALTGTLRAGLRKFSEATMKDVAQRVKKISKELVKEVRTDNRFRQLKSSTRLRGQLGMAAKRYKFKSDTDWEDLLHLLKNPKFSFRKTKVFNTVFFSFPTIDELEQKLTHNLSKIVKGRIKRGPRVSWFRYWEFGNATEVDTATLLFSRMRQVLGAVKQTKNISRRAKRNRKKDLNALIRIIKERSRSRLAIQLKDRPPNADSHIAGRGLITDVYSKFNRKLPARLRKVLRQSAKKNAGKAKIFFGSKL